LLVVLEVLSSRSFEDHGMMEEAGVIEKQPKTPQTFAHSLNISLAIRLRTRKLGRPSWLCRNRERRTHLLIQTN
jgi:hypothetical protein